MCARLRLGSVVLGLVAAAAACRSPDRATDEASAPADAEPVAVGPAAPAARRARDSADSPWSASFVPPEGLVTERLRLEPLAPRHAELDYEALMGSREHLRRTLHWGDWPRSDFTLEENRRDLERHFEEFQRRAAYAYTVLAPGGERCVGCVYLDPVGARGVPPGTRAARIAFWIVADELDSGLDRHFLEALLGWLDERWPLDLAFFPVHPEDERDAALLAELGLVELGTTRDGRRSFVWEPR